MRSPLHLLTCPFKKCWKMRRKKFLKYGLMINKMSLRTQLLKPQKDLPFVITIGWTLPQRILWFSSTLLNPQQVSSNQSKSINPTLVRKEWNNNKFLDLKVSGMMRNKLINSKNNKIRRTRNGESHGKNFLKIKTLQL